MGSRGAISRRTPATDLAPIEVVPSPPDGLEEAGRGAWLAAWPSSPWLSDADAAAVEQLGRLTDEAVVWRRALAERGPLLSEPMVSPRGDVVGERWVSNPAAAELRRVEKNILDLRQALGLTPTSRARLGVAVATLRKVEADERVRDLMAGYRQASKARGSK